VKVYYLDASALVKRYLRERGTEWLDELLAGTSPTRYLSTSLITVELTAALARAQREGRISKAHRDRVAAQAARECKALLRQAEVAEDVMTAASGLTLRYPLRAYDAVHLATAMILRAQASDLPIDAPIFIAADRTLLTAAMAEGFVTDNPNDHA
jgi:predicted nucleic acid-binding protein